MVFKEHYQPPLYLRSRGGVTLVAVGIKINKAEILRHDMVIAPYARFDKGTT